jgi:hypothetical protein
MPRPSLVHWKQAYVWDGSFGLVVSVVSEHDPAPTFDGHCGRMPGEPASAASEEPASDGFVVFVQDHSL